MAAFALDQIAKLFAIGKIPESGIFLINKSWLTFRLALTTNADLAFGLSVGWPLKYGLIFITLAIIYALAKKLITGQNQTLLIAMSVLAGAAISNLFDRVLRGGVIDFLSISIYNLHWPTFNLADVFITATVILLIIKWPRTSVPGKP
ncbi:hypothetical protein A2482_00160 [Candidatus Falkowbacteria bacterium RIFOXYC2_FULL_48_21]|uniref:Uncharacterized protein n=1 Tax=Candidatus Falkowbacteria bacterium RIFOXYC2_FULL_48_21 TaxID=1798005 RepID=A0A1F5TDV2_9BACT|nr:MAG: hypothetical protein A2482_00160 [Candidatus Falkowbacteria bacterium RIFOXYC2_FULL_48_21]